eukprot:gene7702-biopygen22559
MGSRPPPPATISSKRRRRRLRGGGATLRGRQGLHPPARKNAPDLAEVGGGQCLFGHQRRPAPEALREKWPRPRPVSVRSASVPSDCIMRPASVPRPARVHCRFPQLQRACPIAGVACKAFPRSRPGGWSVPVRSVPIRSILPDPLRPALFRSMRFRCVPFSVRLVRSKFCFASVLFHCVPFCSVPSRSVAPRTFLFRSLFDAVQERTRPGCVDRIRRNGHVPDVFRTRPQPPPATYTSGQSHTERKATQSIQFRTIRHLCLLSRGEAAVAVHRAPSWDSSSAGTPHQQTYKSIF